LLQVAVYCGIPAGIDSTRIAREAFAELEREEQPAAGGTE
jgi:4-carboxymuconolactone decarboxylase